MSKLCIDPNIPCHACDNLPTRWIIRPWTREAAERIVYAREISGQALAAICL
jgi:hypothetical protein